MPNVITFTPRPRPVVLKPAPPPADLDLRAHLEEAAAVALDAADKIIAVLDRIEDGAVIESKPAPVVIAAEPIRLLQPAEVQVEKIAEAQEAEPENLSAMISEPITLPEGVILPEPLAWYGAGNVVSFVGIALFNLATRRL